MYHGLCYTSHRALAGIRNSSVGHSKGVGGGGGIKRNREKMMFYHRNTNSHYKCIGYGIINFVLFIYLYFCLKQNF